MVWGQGISESEKQAAKSFCSMAGLQNDLAAACFQQNPLGVVTSLLQTIRILLGKSKVELVEELLELSWESFMNDDKRFYL